jgi:hypothetical protein
MFNSCSTVQEGNRDVMSTPGGENTENLTHHLEFRVIRRAPVVWFTDAELAEMWGVAKRTVRNWRCLARRHGYSPNPNQFRIIRVNAARRYVMMSADYAAIIEALFRTKEISLKKA